jgi:hypothetical protein
METPRTVATKLEPLLKEFSAQLADVEDEISRQGTISLEICAKCSQKNITKVVKFGEDSRKSIVLLLDWIRENEIRDLTSSGDVVAFRSTKKEVENVKGNIPLLEMGQALRTTAEKVFYEYRMSASKLRKKGFAQLLKNQFSSLRTCSHISNILGDNSLALLSKTQQRLDFEGRGTQRVEELWENPEVVNRYTVLCKECFSRVGSTGCEESIRKEGFVFVHRCPTRKIIFQNLLEKYGITYVSGEQQTLFERDELMYQLPDLGVLISDSSRDLTPTIESLKPNCLLAFGRKQKLPPFLHYGTNVILFDTTAEKDAFFVFDRNAPIEASQERIIEMIVTHLDGYSSEVRGKEHDKLIEAFRRIGEELGFITEAEMSQKGARVDIVWLGRDGNVEVAIEVETSAQWKKDIVTTWETSPKLAVVLAHYKTDKGTEDITQYNLLQHMPHNLLFISYLQKRAYLIEKGDIIRAFDMETAK